eukprot:651731_1
MASNLNDTADSMNPNQSYQPQSNESITEVNTQILYLVFGFVRDCEILLHMNAIPDAVIFVCISYYNISHAFGEVATPLMVSGFCGNVVYVAATTEYCAMCSIYASHWISSLDDKAVSWKLKVDNMGHTRSGLSIGIVSTKHHQNINNWMDSGGSYYYECTGILRVDGIRQRPDTGPFEKGDILILTLDLAASTITVHRNDQPGIVIFRDVTRDKDINYKFAMSFWKQDSAVTLLTAPNDITISF